MLKKSALFFFGNLTASLLGFVTLILLTRLVEPQVYGVYAYLFAAMQLATPFFFTWVRLAVLRDQSADKSLDLRKTILFAIAVVIPLIAITITIAHLLKIDIKNHAFELFLMISLLGFYEILLEYIRSKQLERVYVSMVITRSVLYFTLALGLVFLLQSKVTALIIAFIATYLLTSLFGFWKFKKHPFAPMQKERIKQWIKYSPAPTLIAILATLVSVSDRFFINHYLSLEFLGQYAATAEFARQLILAPISAFTAYFMSKAIENYNTLEHKDYNIYMSNAFEFLLAFLLPIVFGLLLIGCDILRLLFSEKFSQASELIISFIALGIAFNVISNHFFHAVYHAKKKYSPIVIQLIFSLILNSLFLMLLIKPYGIKGAAIALMCAEGIGVIFSYFLSQREVKLNLFNQRVINTLLVNIAIYLILTLFFYYFAFSSYLKIVFAIILYGLSYFLFVYFSNKEEVKTFILKVLKRK